MIFGLTLGVQLGSNLHLHTENSWGIKKLIQPLGGSGSHTVNQNTGFFLAITQRQVEH